MVAQGTTGLCEIKQSCNNTGAPCYVNISFQASDPISYLFVCSDPVCFIVSVAKLSLVVLEECARMQHRLSTGHDIQSTR